MAHASGLHRAEQISFLMSAIIFLSVFLSLVQKDKRSLLVLLHSFFAKV